MCLTVRWIFFSLQVTCLSAEDLSLYTPILAEYAEFCVSYMHTAAYKNIALEQAVKGIFCFS